MFKPQSSESTNGGAAALYKRPANLLAVLEASRVRMGQSLIISVATFLAIASSFAAPVENIIVDSATKTVINPNVVLSPQQYDSRDYLVRLTDAYSLAARFTFTSGSMSGKPGWTPGPGYPNLAYVRDFAMAVRARPDIVSPTQLLDIINAHFTAHGGSGQIYDAIGVNSAAFSGVVSSPFPSYDNVFYLVDLCYSHYLKTGLTTAYTTNQTALINALAYVPVTNHLVYIADNATLTSVHNGWGFQDQVASSGYELICSVLRYRALGQLAEMCTAAGQTSNAAAYTTERNLIPANLQTQLWDAAAGWFYNASIKNHQHNVMGSSFAALQPGLCSSTVTAAIVSNLMSGRPGNANDLAGKGFYDHGMIRHLPLDENWTSTRGGAGASGQFQNGGYWPVATGWVCQVLFQNGHAAEADKIMGEYVAYSRTLPLSSVPIEWANTSGPYLGTGNYIASAALPLEPFKNRLLSTFPPSQPNVIIAKLSLSYSDTILDDTTADVPIATLPPRSVVLTTTVKHSVAWTGGSTSAATAQIQTANNTYGTAFNIHQAPGAGVLDFYTTTKRENFAADTPIYLHLAVTANDITDLTAGALEAWVTYITLP